METLKSNENEKTEEVMADSENSGSTPEVKNGHTLGSDTSDTNGDNKFDNTNEKAEEEPELEGKVQAKDKSDEETSASEPTFLKVKDLSALYASASSDAAYSSETVDPDDKLQIAAEAEISCSEQSEPTGASTDEAQGFCIENEDRMLDAPTQNLINDPVIRTALCSRKRNITECFYGDRCFYNEPEHFISYSHRHLDDLLDDMKGGLEIPSTYRPKITLRLLKVQLDILRQVELPTHVTIELTDSD